MEAEASGCARPLLADPGTQIAPPLPPQVSRCLLVLQGHPHPRALTNGSVETVLMRDSRRGTFDPWGVVDWGVSEEAWLQVHAVTQVNRTCGDASSGGQESRRRRLKIVGVRVP